MESKRRYPYTKGEEIFNSFSHGIGALLSVAGCVVMIVLASGGTAVASSAIYGFSMIFMYIMSTIYHAIPFPRAKRILQVLDHASIYLLIVGCYAPVMLILLHDSPRAIILYIAVWVLAITGIVLNIISVERFKRICTVLYLLMGWAILLDIRSVVERLGTPGTMLLILGGICYTVGVIFYKLKQVRYMHGIWHLFVLAGSVVHYICFLQHIILA